MIIVVALMGRWTDWTLLRRFERSRLLGGRLRWIAEASKSRGLLLNQRLHENVAAEAGFSS